MPTHQDFELESLVKAKATRFTAPSELSKKIGIAIRQEDLISAALKKTIRRTVWPQWFNLGLSFAFGLLLSVGLLRIYPMSNDQEVLSQEIVSGHVRSLMAGHLADVASSDQHTVKPWFTGKLDFSPPVQDLKAEGFALSGGRLDYVDKHPVAALVYQRRLHTINVFVWPSESNPSQDMKPLSRQGFNLVNWKDAGMQFWAVSDLAADELKTFAQLMQHVAAKSAS